MGERVRARLGHIHGTTPERTRADRVAPQTLRTAEPAPDCISKLPYNGMTFSGMKFSAFQRIAKDER